MKEGKRCRERGEKWERYFEVFVFWFRILETRFYSAFEKFLKVYSFKSSKSYFRFIAVSGSQLCF